MPRSFIHKGALIMVIALSGRGDVMAQGDAPHLLQAAVDGLRSSSHAQQIATLLRDQRGVHMARFDRNTRNMMLHVDPDLELDRTAINALLEEHGVSVRCLRREAVGAMPFRHVNADDCQELAPAVR